MPEPPPASPITQAEMMELLRRQTEAGIALVVTGVVEDWLEKLLLASGRSLSNKTAKQLFGGMGPLSSFSGKIEIANLFELIDEATYRDMRVIKDIRNAFAHTTQFVNFDTPKIAEKCRNLSEWTEGIDKQTFFTGRALHCINTMKATMDQKMYANALRDYPAIDDGSDDG